jgi:hypothetical protein
MLRAKVQIFGFLALAALGVTLAQCSGSGGNASSSTPIASPSPSPTPTPAPGAVTFRGPNVSGNTMTVFCTNGALNTFTISQANYSGTFTVVSNSTSFTVSPSSGTSATTFTVTDSGGAITNTLTVTAGGGVTATLTLVGDSSSCG